MSLCNWCQENYTRAGDKYCDRCREAFKGADRDKPRKPCCTNWDLDPHDCDRGLGVSRGD